MRAFAVGFVCGFVAGGAAVVVWALCVAAAKGDER